MSTLADNDHLETAAKHRVLLWAWAFFGVPATFVAFAAADVRVTWRFLASTAYVVVMSCACFVLGAGISILLGIAATP